MNKYDRKMIVVYLKKLREKISLIKWGWWQKINAKNLQTYETNKDCARCRDCGRTVHDYFVEDSLWLRVMGNKNGVWCYDCFAERARNKNVKEYCSVTEDETNIESNY